MKAATRGDKPEWLTPPPAVTTARVCRLSGRLAAEGCEDAQVVGEDGDIERQAMVYTEYFAPGTRPTVTLHPASNAGFLWCDRLGFP